MIDLLNTRCQHYNKDALPLDKGAVESLLGGVAGWHVNDDGKSISKCFKFKNYYQTIAFVNANAYVSHEQDHHPDLEVGYNRCIVTFSTHSIGGLSQNDFICAAKFNALLPIENVTS